MKSMLELHRWLKSNFNSEDMSVDGSDVYQVSRTNLFLDKFITIYTINPSFK